MKKINFNKIKTATTVEEFRENLKKYFVTTNKRTYLMVKGDDESTHIKIDDLSSLSDLYKHNLKSVSPSISVVINKLSTDDVLKHMHSRDFSDVLSDEKKYSIYEFETDDDIQEFVNTKNPYWYGIDNQVLRAFYVKTLGKFSGYTTGN
jgi:hypothetical protein